MDSWIQVRQKDEEVVFDGLVSPGDWFSFAGTDHDTLGTEITLFVDGVETTKVHTSCSKAIGPEMVFGPFRVVAGTSKEGGPLCPLVCEVLGEPTLKIHGREIKWKLTNTTEFPLTISRIRVLWPDANGHLKKIKLDRKVIFEELRPTTSTEIDSDWNGSTKDREIKEGKSEELKIEFENDAVPGGYVEEGQ